MHTSASATLDLDDVRRRLKAIFVGSIGNLVEWYDFYAYSAFSLYFAASFFPGNDLVVQQLNAAVLFARHPYEYAKIVRDPGRIPDAVEETLRWVSPSQYQGRMTTRDVTWHGQTVPAGIGTPPTVTLVLVPRLTPFALLMVKLLKVVVPLMVCAALPLKLTVPVLVGVNVPLLVQVPPMLMVLPAVAASVAPLSICTLL